MIRRDGLQRGSWGTGSSARAAAAAHALSTAAVRERERPVELVVSQLIGVMPFVWIRTDDAPGPASIRGVIERNAIALLSNFRKESIDPPSPAWLGLHSARERVRRSGLWNNNHVDEVYEPSFLEVLARAARETDRC